MADRRTRGDHGNGSAGSAARLLVTGRDGPLSRLLAQADWAATPLGPVSGWPPELRTAASVCLNSPFPILVMWGRELSMVYNDAFVPILGAKHPALGQPCQQVWADAWPVVGSMLNRVLDQGEPTYREDLRLTLQRHGFDEEVYFTFAYSPVPRADGTVGGVFTVVSESTGHVLGARRMRALQDLAASSAPASSAPASVTEACAAAMRALGGHRADLAFGLTYRLDDGDGTARPVASFGLAAPELPAELRGGGAGDWIRETAVTGTGATRSGLAARLPGLALPGASPAGDADTDVAVALPLPGGADGRASGALVLGTSRYLPLDADYQRFLGLVARQVAAKVSDAEAHAAQRRRAEELTELDRAKTRFFTSVSHELRTPLALIAGPAADSLADARDPLPPAQRMRMEIISRNSGRLRRMVDMLLDLAKIEDGRLRPELAAVEIGELTRGVAESFAPAVERAGLAFTVDCPATGHHVLVDPDMWEQVILNLLSNAVKFTADGVIEVRLRAADDIVELRVSDTGTGIPADQLPLLFERFHQVRGAARRSHEGSGIGLALVRELATLHGGDVEAASRPGKGSVFTVRIPAARAPAPAPAPAGGHPVVAGSAARYVEEARQWSAQPPGPRDEPGTTARPKPAGRDTVLVAEDNADMRQYLTGLLQRGYAVTVAGDGREALERARAVHPDLILADVMMPRIDGFELLRELRADPATARIPMILLSARAGEEAAIDGLAAGADDYLAKPFSSAELLARVRSNLGLARARNRESAWRAALFNAMQGGLFVATGDGTVTEVNDAFCQLLGYPASELPWPVPHPWWPRADTDPEGFAQVTDAFSAVLAAGSGRFTVPLRHRDGRVLWTDVAIDEVRDRDQRVIVGTLRDVTAERLATDRDARAFDEQRQVALALQRSILGPADLPAGIAVHYEPATATLEVGGDWYDVIELPGGRRAVVVGDVVGHGLPAATVMGQLRSAARALLLEGNGPARVLRALDQFSALLPGADCTTVFCAVIDPRAGTVRFSNAGHPPALLAAPDGTVSSLEHALTPALAMAPGRERPEATAALPAGATLLLYTDGLVERRPEAIDVGIERAGAALAECRHLAPEQVAAHLRTRLLGDARDDDVAFLVYRQPAGPPAGD